MAFDANIDPELRGTDRLFALIALVQERLSNIDGKLDKLQEAVDGTLDDHEERIESLEHWRSEVHGGRKALVTAMFVLPTLLGGFGAYITLMVGKHS